jgi:NADPH:quinone reductase-like Zn-dependent oxidoreductase
MKAAYFAKHGPVDVLQVGELPDPELGPVDVRVQVKACALNRLDLFVREGWPGVVSEVGSDVSGVAVGDEVLVNPGLNFEADEDGNQKVPRELSIVGETRWGGLAEQCVVPYTHVVPKPAEMSWEEAAALPLTAITAMQMVKRRGAVKAGSRVLIIGAGGGVSTMCLQIAKSLGAWVAATTGGSGKVEKARALGADLVVDYQADDWSKQLFLATDKQGFDVVIDSVGAATWKHSLRLLGVGGRLVTCGATTGPIGETDIRLVFWRQLQILGSTMGVPQDLHDALDMWRAGTLKVEVDSVWPLEKAREAQEHMARSGHFGKIVITP